MNEIVPYSFGDQPVRIADRAGEPWFVLADVCRVLGLANVGNAAARLDDDERDDIRLPDATGREQDTAICNEPGLYRLIMRSNKPAAKQFIKWLTSEVLPAIRRTGRYGGAAPALDLSNPAVLHTLLLEHTGRSLAIEARVAELEPQAEALARLTDTEGAMCITDAAKALGVPPRRLFAWLEAHSWIYRRGEAGHWVAFQAKLSAGVLDHKAIRISRRGKPDKLVENVVVTPKGLARLATDQAGK